MNKYELTVVLDGKVGSAKKKKVTEAFEKVLATFNGKILSTKDWGVKELAYKIAKSETGLFTLFEIELDPTGVKALDEKLRNDIDVIRYLLIRKEK